MSSAGNVPAAQCFPIDGMILVDTSSRTVSRTIRSSWV
jgi:hypothetical protein